MARAGSYVFMAATPVTYLLYDQVGELRPGDKAGGLLSFSDCLVASCGTHPLRAFPAFGKDPTSVMSTCQPGIMPPGFRPGTYTGIAGSVTVWSAAAYWLFTAALPKQGFPLSATYGRALTGDDAPS